MDHLFKWATDIRFTRAPEIRPTYPQYLADLDISVAYHTKLVSFARQFFQFAQRRWPDRYERVDHIYLDSLRSNLKEKEVKRRQIYTLGGCARPGGRRTAFACPKSASGPPWHSSSSLGCASAPSPRCRWRPSIGIKRR